MNGLIKPLKTAKRFEADTSKYNIYLIGYDEHERYCRSEQ